MTHTPPPLVVPRCDVCQGGFDTGDHRVRYESVYLLLHLCPGCIEGYVRKHGADCINCGEWITPHSQVAVYKGDGETLLGHTSVACNPAGNSFYGYWGKGKLNSVFSCVEQC